jgi:adenosylmethionine-8-amino-7-oxononanoate aminotransferase
LKAFFVQVPRRWRAPSSLPARSVSALVFRLSFDESRNSIQYWYEQKQPQRKNFISRQLSYHGNTVTTLSLSGHPARRKPYEEILQHENFHRVSPAYAKRFRHPEETEEQYVERLRQELEDKFLELGPDTVVGCKSSPTLTGDG